MIKKSDTKLAATLATTLFAAWFTLNFSFNKEEGSGSIYKSPYHQSDLVSHCGAVKGLEYHTYDLSIILSDSENQNLVILSSPYAVPYLGEKDAALGMHRKPNGPGLESGLAARLEAAQLTGEGVCTESIIRADGNYCLNRIIFEDGTNYDYKLIYDPNQKSFISVE